MWRCGGGEGGDAFVALRVTASCQNRKYINIVIKIIAALGNGDIMRCSAAGTLGCRFSWQFA